MAKRDVHQEITNTIITHLENGTAPWHRCWDETNTGGSLPRRANGEFYKGINVLLLWIAADEKGYTADQWMTFKQAKQVGGNVRKGEKGTQIVFFSAFEKEDKETGKEVKIPFLKSYTVFNVQQIENLPCDITPDMFEEDREELSDIDAAAAFFNATGATVQNNGMNPCYVPARDTICMPEMNAFESAESYYAVLAHELIHWTGATHRLDRLRAKGKGKEYAFEELVAELGACFLLPQFSIDPNLENSAAYVASWLKALKNDKRFIFQAAAAAQKAVDFATEQTQQNQFAIAAE